MFVFYMSLVDLLYCCPGRALSVTWSLDAKRIFSGSSNGYVKVVFSWKRGYELEIILMFISLCIM